MKVPAACDIGAFVDLKFKAGSWEKSGLPEEGCRMRHAALEQLLAHKGAYGPDDLIRGLMDWLDVTDEPLPALTTLRMLLDRHYPADHRSSGRCCFVDEQGMERMFHVGTVDWRQPLIAWQRREWIIAAGQPSTAQGRIIIGAPGPLSLKTAQKILSISMLGYMGEPFDSFEGGLTAASGTGVFYLWERGEVTPTRWDHGLDEQALKSLHSPGTTLSWLPSNQLAMQVAIAANYCA